MPVVLLTGNHDIPNTKGKANAIEIYDALGSGLLHVFDRRAVRTITTKRGRLLQIAAIPYLTKSTLLARDEQAAMSVQETTEAVETKYEEAIIAAAEECRFKPDIPTVFMGHFTVSNAEVGTTQAGYLLNEPKVSKEAPESGRIRLRSRSGTSTSTRTSTTASSLRWSIQAPSSASTLASATKPKASRSRRSRAAMPISSSTTFLPGPFWRLRPIRPRRRPLAPFPQTRPMPAATPNRPWRTRPIWF